jgi:hypothetical protein
LLRNLFNAADAGTSAGRLASGQADNIVSAPSTGGRTIALSGRPTEVSVSNATGIPLNQGPGRQVVGGTGPGGFRIPDLKPFGPNASLAVRGSIVEIKNIKRLSATPQLIDLANEAHGAGGHLEIFTNATAPKKGKLANLIQQNKVVIRPLP